MARCAFVATLLLGLAAASTARADFKEALAARLGASPEFLILNIPPRPDVWLGAVFTCDMRIPMVRGVASDPALSRGARTSLESVNLIELSAGAKAGLSGWLSFAAKAGDVAHVTMNLPDLTIIDIDHDEILKRVKKSPDIAKAAQRGRIPLIVIKAYEGTPKFTLERKSNASAEAWAQIQKTAAEVRLDASALSQDRAIYEAKSPIVFAFEVAQAMFDFAEASKGKDPKYALLRAPSHVFTAYEIASDEKSAKDVIEVISAVEGPRKENARVRVPSTEVRVRALIQVHKKQQGRLEAKDQRSTCTVFGMARGC